MSKSSPLDADIDRYSATARTVLDLRKPAKRLGELALYTAAAGSALALAPGADASIIYSGVRNITVHRVTNRTSSASVDLNANGQRDFAFGISSYTYGVQHDTAPVVGFPGSAPGSYGSAWFFNNYRGSLLKLAASSRAIGASYGPSTGLFPLGYMRHHFVTASGSATSVVGFWNPGPSASSTGFAGVRIGSLNDGGSKQFGWLHFKLITGADDRLDSLTLIDWAFQSVPGEAIHVGDKGISVPEPSGLGLMALGALGLAALRRKRGKNSNRTADTL